MFPRQRRGERQRASEQKQVVRGVANASRREASEEVVAERERDV